MSMTVQGENCSHCDDLSPHPVKGMWAQSCTSFPGRAFLWAGFGPTRAGRWAEVRECGSRGLAALKAPELFPLVSSLQYCDGKGPPWLSYCGDQPWESRGWSVQARHPVLLGMLLLARLSWTAGHCCKKALRNICELQHFY